MADDSGDPHAAARDPDAGLVTVNHYGSSEEAQAAARVLVEHGLGASITSLPDDEGHDVRVLPFEEARAAELLGLRPPTPRPEANPEQPLEPQKAPIPWKTVLAVWAVAMVVIPVIAGFLVYFIVR
jgi:hypothetical protein